MSANPLPPALRRWHFIQHVPFEGPAYLEQWVTQRGAVVATTRIGEQSSPHLDAFDVLVLLGGPMGVHDVTTHTWLTDEKQLIRAALAAQKRVLGICLGAQLIAEALGAAVKRAREKEIGWFPVQRSSAARATDARSWLPSQFTPLHWHGDACDLPSGALQLAETPACEVQAFVWGGQALGLQFHLEATPESVAALVEHCRAEIEGGRYQQSADSILATKQHFSENRRVLDVLLRRFLDL